MEKFFVSTITFVKEMYVKNSVITVIGLLCAVSAVFTLIDILFFICNFAFTLIPIVICVAIAVFGFHYLKEKIVK